MAKPKIAIIWLEPLQKKLADLNDSDQEAPICATLSETLSYMVQHFRSRH